jgi:hypothetical protein
MITQGMRTLLKISLSVTSFLLLLGTLEGISRLWHWEWRFENFLVGELHYVRAAYPTQHDPMLGWIPRPGTWSGDVFRGKQITIETGGIRSNGRQKLSLDPPDSPVILAVGDSFTFGDEVSDNETWPAVLERKLETTVINAGVFGYGFDQSFLRARELIQKQQVDVLILGLIPDDIQRCQLSQRSGAEKPYFQIEKGRLQLHNQPVPAPTGLDVGTFKEVTGYSFFFYKMMRKAFPAYWLEGSLSRAVNTQGEEISCLLIREMARITRERAIHFVLLIQYEQDPPDSSLELIDRLLHCVNSVPVQVVDLRADLLAIKKQDPKNYKGLFNSHMTASGNRFVALTLWRALNGPLIFVDNPIPSVGYGFSDRSP